MDKDQDPIIQENSDAPELQETLENEEINTANTEAPVEKKPAEAEEKETTNESVEEKKEEPKTEESSPESLLANATPVTKDNRTTIIVVIAIAVIGLLGLGFGIFALIQMNKSPKEQINNLMDTASDLLEETTKKQDEIKEKLEKEKQEKEDKEKKEKEEKEKKEKEEKEAKEKAEKEAAAKKEALKTTLDAEGVISQVSEALITENLVIKEQLSVEERSNILYQPAGYKTHIYLAGKNLSGEALAGSDDLMDDIMPVVNTTLGELGFEKLETLKDPFIWISSAAIYYNSSTNVACTSYHFLPQIVACASATSYSLSEKSLTNSLAEAYNKTEGKYPIVVAANGDSLNGAIEDSGYKQYQTMTVNLGMNAASIFYRESPTSEWKYLLSTQAAIDCSIYSTELQKGLGKHCQTQN